MNFKIFFNSNFDHFFLQKRENMQQNVPFSFSFPPHRCKIAQLKKKKKGLGKGLEPLRHNGLSPLALSLWGGLMTLDT
jgi:hypothetical protein